jgi:hypothetical protein
VVWPELRIEPKLTSFAFYSPKGRVLIYTARSPDVGTEPTIGDHDRLRCDEGM